MVGNLRRQINGPKVSVLMSVHNGERYLREAVESILNQTFTNFEFIIVDDGSTDATATILDTYTDHRIVRLRNSENIGLAGSLNRGLRIARGEFVARQDADDISFPGRISSQLDFMEAHPEIGILATWVEVIDQEGGHVGYWRIPTSPGLMAWFLFFGNCLRHSSIMMRCNVIESIGLYSHDFLTAQDYDLWSRAALVTRIASIPKFLVQYRSWEGSAGSSYTQEQQENVIKIMHSVITRLLGAEVPIEAVKTLRQMIRNMPPDDPRQIETVANLIQQLCYAYLQKNTLDRVESKKVVHDAAAKVYNIAMSSSDIPLWKRLIILVQALPLDPQLISKKIIVGGMRALIRMIGTASSCQS